MDDLIGDNGLAEELEDRMVGETGNTNFWLGMVGEMDEESDEEDPEAVANEEVHELLREDKEKKSFIEAVQGALECRAMATDLERARMQLEDLRGQMLRGAAH